MLICHEFNIFAGESSGKQLIMRKIERKFYSIHKVSKPNAVLTQKRKHRKPDQCYLNLLYKEYRDLTEAKQQQKQQ